MTENTTPPRLRLVVSNGAVLPGTAAATLAERLLDYVNVQPGQRVIEFTFGPSRLGWRFRALGCDVVSVNLAEAPSRSIPQAWLATFDLAVTVSALHQVADASALLADVAACVRPGGVCGGLEPSHDGFEPFDMRGFAMAAGLALVGISEQTPNVALFWKARVPALQALPLSRLSLAA